MKELFDKILAELDIEIDEIDTKTDLYNNV